jgi:hypothetical protein
LTRWPQAPCICPPWAVASTRTRPRS